MWNQDLVVSKEKTICDTTAFYQKTSSSKVDLESMKCHMSLRSALKWSHRISVFCQSLKKS